MKENGDIGERKRKVEERMGEKKERGRGDVRKIRERGE